MGVLRLLLRASLNPRRTGYRAAPLWPFVLSLLMLSACGGAPPPSPDAILETFRGAGLTVADVTSADVLRPEVANAAPSCQAVRFNVVGDDGARVVVCAQAGDAAKVATYYRTLGDTNAMFFSHVFEASGGRVVLQANGGLDAALVQQYADLLPK